MPRISEFYGITVAMHYNDHEPPRFHAVYGSFRAIVGIDPIRVLRGRLPQRAESLVFEWTAIHQRELAENWRRARQHAALRPITPLD